MTEFGRLNLQIFERRGSERGFHCRFAERIRFAVIGAATRDQQRGDN